MTELSAALEFLDTASYPNSKIENFVNGDFLKPKNDQFLASFEPGTGEKWIMVPDSDDFDANLAVSAARNAFDGWAGISVEQRAEFLQKLATIIEGNREKFAEYESKDQGKPISLAKTVDIPRCVHNFRFFASAVTHHINESTVQNAPIKALNYTLTQPIGVALLITPWNLPLYLTSFKLAPALMCGNTCVVKCSENTSVTAWLLAKAVSMAGFPRGVINFVFGTGPNVGEALVTHPDIDLISFTGSTKIGRHIQGITAHQTKKLSLELGGKNPCVVFDDADLEKAVPAVVRSCFFNQGEICLATSRLFVHKSIIDEFLARMVFESSKWTVGCPKQSETRVGALNSKLHFEKVKSYIELAKTEGIQVLSKFDDIHLDEHCKNGYFVAPTILVNVPAHSKLMREEIFGPVVCVNSFETDTQAIQYANDTEYGLSASIWTENVKRMHNVAAKIQAGTVWCNCWLVRDLHMPFGGMKASGIGREGFKDSIEFYSEKKTVCVSL